MRTLKKLFVAVLCICMFASVFTVSAKDVEYAPYSGYEYNADNESVAAPATYIFDTLITYEDMGLETPLANPTDIYWSGETLYILDADNSRIVCLDENLKAKGILENLTDASGEVYNFKGAKGLAVNSEGEIYIADTGNLRVIVTDDSCVVKKVIEKPNTTLVGYDYTFDVSKILVSTQGNIYVTAGSVNNGAFVFDENYEFSYFFGRSTVQRTADVFLNYIRKQFMTREQIQKLQNYSPATILNFDIDEEGFVYTVTKSGANTAATLNKLNFSGQNIIKSEGIISTYGDLEGVRGILTNNHFTSFSDVDIDNQDFVHLLDEGRGKIFQYTQNGQLVSVFGGYGTQRGMFSKPIAIETIGSRVLVLDSGEGGVAEFVPTDYTVLLREAFIDLDTSDPQRAIELWEEVKTYNTNSLYPYYGLGMAYEKLGDYKAAMDNFKLASSNAEYSDAYHEYRKEYAADNLVWILLIAVAAIALVVVVVKLIHRALVKASGNEAFTVLENKYTFPLYTLTHPSDGFGQFKYRKELPSYLLSAIIILAFFLIKVYEYFGTGYIFNTNEPEDYSILSTFIGSIAIYILFVVGNWAVCSLMDGNGKMKEIASVTAYSLIPYIVSLLVNTVLSNFLSLDEGMMLNIVTIIGVVWAGMLLIVGLSQIHQYYIGKTVWTTILSVFAMIIIAVLVFLLFSLVQQVLYFGNSIIEELRLR
ncbi:MAG: YIP1 family protein [Clostridia bacterium]|nr:YIP1 family protein [Clostridia bacterium]